MDRLVFRPLRTQSPAVMLVATFAVAFLLQSIALLWFGPLGKIASSLAPLNRPVTISGVDIRKIAIVAVDRRRGVSRRAPAAARAHDGRPADARGVDGLSARRACSACARTASSAVRCSSPGLLAAVVAVMLTVQTPLVTPDFALRDTIVVLAGVVLGGLNRLVPATLGGFAIGFASGLLGGALPTTQSQYLPAILFAAVILVLLVRPNGLFTRGHESLERV